MAKESLNINKIKEEIDRRKSGELNSPPKGKKSFLTELRKSFETGVQTESVNKIKQVANKASEFSKTGEKPPYTNISHHPTPTKRENYNEDYNQREEQLFKNFEATNKKTLAQALEEQIGRKTPSGDIQQYQNQPTNQINEEFLLRKIDERLSNYLVENIGSIFNDSIKNVILEHFTKEKIKEVVLENNDIIRETVINVIRDLQKKKKN